jgi:hypothetical protein
MKTLKIMLLFLSGMVLLPEVVLAQSALQQLEDATNTRVSVPSASAPVRVGSASGAASSAKSVLGSSTPSMSNVVTGALIQGLLNNLLSPTPKKSQADIEAEQAEAERVAKEAEIKRQEEEAQQQAQYENLINSSKTLSGAGSLDFKSLDGDMESMRKGASDPFDQGSSGNPIKTVTRGNDFFGVPLSDPDFETVIEPETNPVVRDEEKAVELSKEYLEKERLNAEKLQKEKLEKKNLEKEKLVVDIIGGAMTDQVAKGEPIVEKPDCIALSEKLTRYRSDMVRFQEWNAGTLSELKKWEDQNNDAFWNAVKDGASAAFGVFVDYLNETRSSASKIKKILEQNEGKYISDGVLSSDQIIQYKKLLDQRITLCNITDLAKESMKPWDYVNLSRNLLQGTTEKLATSDGDCMEIVNVLKRQGYLSETPWVDAGQFLAGEAINKFLKDPGAVIKPNSLIKGSLKLPYVTIAQLAVDEAYNVTDMLTSFKNVCTLRDADGKASEAVKKIQNDMDNIKIQLKGCPSQN